MTKKIKEALGPSSGVYETVGIPVLGAIGGGDGAKDKIGKNRRPRFHGDTGSPSQAADSGWSSQGVSRVNKGYEQDAELFYDVMFPEQDTEENIDDEENIYYMYDDTPLITRKLPQHSIRLEPGSKYIKSPSELKESYMSKNRYSLKPLFEDTSQIRLDEFDLSNIADIGLPNIDMPDIDIDIDFSSIPGMEFLQDIVSKPAEIIADELGPLADLMLPALDSIQDIAGDLLAAGTGFIPIVGDAVALGLVAFNIAQLQGDLARADAAIAAFQRNPSDEGRNLLAKILEEMNTNVIDVMQRALEAVPDPGVSEATSLMLSVKQNALRLRSLLSKLGMRHSSERIGFGQRIREKAQITLVVKPALTSLVGLIYSGYAPESLIENKNDILRLPKVMAALYDLITVWDAHGEVADILGLEDEIEPGSEEQEEILLPGFEYSEAMPEPLAEFSMQDYIREILISEYAQRYMVNLRGPNPKGYLSYDPKEIGEQPEVFSDDDVTDFNLNAVLYPNDGGYSGYSPKPLSESNIKEFIRELVLETLADDDIDEEDDADRADEISSGGVPGAAMPMQTGSKKNIKNG